MTRLAHQHQAVNLSQGFTDEPPPFRLIWGAVVAMLGGSDEGMRQIEQAKAADPQLADAVVRDRLARLHGTYDEFNQYSYPFGLPDLRRAIASYANRWIGLEVDPETETTVVLGSTEGLASVFAALGHPGDGVVVFEPFHEMYPSQAEVFGLIPRMVTLRERKDGGGWWCDPDELRSAADGARMIVLNTPHNPTGMVFESAELELIAEVAQSRDLLVIADEIYEHIIFDGAQHRSIATSANMKDRTIILNSISKTANATGWRVGWVISPAKFTERIRAVHDTLVIQAPTPLQKATVSLLQMPDSYFAGLGPHFEDKRRILTDALRAVGFRITAPRGAYYLFADYRSVPVIGKLHPMDAAMHLIEHIGVAAVPGDNFYAKSDDGERYLRFAFCRSRATLALAADRLRRLGTVPQG